MKSHHNPAPAPQEFGYAFLDMPDDEILAILGALPGRWGRMPPLSRAMVVETGRFLAACGIPTRQEPPERKRPIGLIGGTTYGSLTPDLDFVASLQQGELLASPAIFGYTLANIPLAEAANHYRFTGPVYAVIDPKAPLAAAIREAGRLLRIRPVYDCILACAFDDDPAAENRLSLTFSLVRNNA